MSAVLMWKPWVRLGSKPAPTPAVIRSNNQFAPTGVPTPARLVTSYGNLPLSFEANQGQTAGPVKFLARGRGYALFLTGDEAVLSLRGPGVAQGGAAATGGVGPSSAGPGPNAVRPYNRRHPLGAETRIHGAARQHSLFGPGALPSPLLPVTLDADSLADIRVETPPEPSATALCMRLVGANAHVAATGMDELPGKSNYFIGNNPKKWRTNVPTYAKVKYAGVYPGVDLVYYGNRGGQLEYDFVVAPGGDLIVNTDGGEVRFHKPVVYQPAISTGPRTSDLGLRTALDGQYVLQADNQVGFKVAAYDHSKPLVIDPVLSYSTYLGGSTFEHGNGIAVDSSGNVYVTGYTESSNFPTANPFQATLKGYANAFIAKFNPTGSALVYSTYFGGSSSSGDSGAGIAVDSSGNAYVTGVTQSTNFTTVNPLQATNKAAKASGQTAFVAKLNAAGSALVYSTYLGGSTEDNALGIAVDSSGNAYVVGWTLSPDFPTMNPLQATNFGYHVFVAKIGAADVPGGRLVPSTLAFGPFQEVGTTSSVQTVTLDNVGSAALNISSIVASGDFSQTNNCGAVVAPAMSASCSINITFTPTTAGIRTGTLSITDNASNSPQMVSLAGTGISPVQLSAYNLTFGSQNLNTTSAAQTLTLSNNNSITLAAYHGTSGDFAHTSTCRPAGSDEWLLIAGAQCTISITFTPTELGTRSGTLIIADGENPTVTVALTGTGTAPVAGISLPSLTFGNQSEGAASASQPITLSNTGDGALTITSIVASANFAETDNCNGSVAANSSCTINVTFSPTVTGTLQGTLTITDNAYNSPQTVNLSGTGVAQVGAWAPAYQFLAAGSSAQFNTVGLAAALPGASGYAGYTACTNNGAGGYWTSSSTLNTSGMQIHDPRSAAILDEPGTVWIAWDNTFIQGMDYEMGYPGAQEPASGDVICAYVALDSVVGMREYFARGQMILYSSAGAADQQIIPQLPRGNALPPEVVYYFDTLPFPDHNGPNPTVNVAATDLLPWDGKFATLRTMGALNTRVEDANYLSLGYGGLNGGAPSTCGPGGLNQPGTRIKSSISTAFLKVADWAFDTGDVDPYTCLPARNWNMASSGAAPVLVIANITNTGAGHLGDPAWVNPQINRYVLANVFSGLNEEVSSITGITGGPAVGLNVFQREPLSGTYNVFDGCITCSMERYNGLQFLGYPLNSPWPPGAGVPPQPAPNSKIASQYYNCMETFVGDPTVVCSSANCSNPLWLQDLAVGYNRKRAVGTTEMVNTVAATADGIAYAFWGYSNYSGKQAQLRYLPVDNIDPLYRSPSANPNGWGILPQCGATLPCANHPTFDKILDGAYPIWTYYRWIYDPGVNEGLTNLLGYTRLTAANGIFDFVPDSSMTVFRSHYAQLARTWYGGTGQYPSNGVTTGGIANAEPEYGGDVGGQVFTISSEVNYMNDQLRKGICSWIDILDQACEQTQWRQ
jgi:hypothetical protein